MNKKVRIISIVAILVMLVMILTGCTKKKSYTYDVETGDKIKIELKTNDEYDISSDLPFKITKDGETQSQGIFITLDQYDQYIELVKNDDDSEIIEEKSKNGIEYTFYSYNDSEYNYVIKISKTNTALLLGNNVSKASAKECFERLAISEEK